MCLYCYFRQSLFPHYCAAVRSSLLNLLKMQLVYILFDGQISSGYDVLACMPDAKKGRMIKAIPYNTFDACRTSQLCSCVYSENRRLQLLGFQLNYLDFVRLRKITQIASLWNQSILQTIWRRICTHH